MPPVEPLITFAERFADEVWQRSSADLLCWQHVFAQECASSRVSIQRVCEAQTDETLALAFKKGVFTEAAFVELLVNRFGPKLQRWFIRHGRRFGREIGDELSNELVQETWYKMFAAQLGNYDATKGFGSFLFVVSRNLFVQRVVRPPRELALADWDGETPSDSVGLEVEFRETQEQVERALGRLPAEQREVLRQTLEGHQPEVISGMIGIPVQVVYRRLFHARRAVECHLRG